MENETLEDEEVVVPSPTEVVEEESQDSETTEDPLKLELDRVQRKSRTKAEKLLYTKKRVEDQLKELGIDDEPEDEDDKPITVGMFKKLQAQTATKTALELVDEVSSETERELLKYHLENTIRSTGNAQQDLNLARILVNAVKNTQIMEQAALKPIAKTHPSGSGAPATTTRPQEELSKEELLFMRPPFNLTKEQVIAARPK